MLRKYIRFVLAIFLCVLLFGCSNKHEADLAMLTLKSCWSGELDIRSVTTTTDEKVFSVKEGEEFSHFRITEITNDTVSFESPSMSWTDGEQIYEKGHIYTLNIKESIDLMLVGIYDASLNITITLDETKKADN